MADWGDVDFETSQPARIPVGQTIGQAYNFALGGFFKILGVMWVPYVVLIGILAVIGKLRNAGVLTPASAPQGTANVIVLFVFLFAAAILLFVQAQGVILEALGQRRGTKLLYFSLDKPVWLLTAALITTTVALAAAIMAILFVVGAIGTAIRVSGGAIQNTLDAKIGITIALGIVSTVFFCTFLYVAIRQFFLLAPVIVAERHLGIRRSWKLSDGNFWRMLTIYLAVVLPAAAVNFAVLLAVPRMSGSGALQQGGAANLISGHNIWFTLLYVLAFSTLLCGLVYGAQTFAYRALVPAEKIEDVF